MLIWYGGGKEACPLIPLVFVASICRLGLEKLNTTVGLPYVETLGSLVEPSLLSNRYSWALVSVSVSLNTFSI